MIQKKEAETNSVSPAKPKIDKPIRVRTAKIVEHAQEATEIQEPIVEEINTENTEISVVNQDEDSESADKKSGKNKSKKKLKMKDKDKKKAKKAEKKAVATKAASEAMPAATKAKK